jgi:hypothetical protein
MTGTLDRMGATGKSRSTPEATEAPCHRPGAKGTR